MNQRRYGTVLSYVSIFVHIIAGLFFTPYLVHSLGKAEYGLYVVIGSLVANLAILDLGLSDSIVKFVSRYRAKDDHEGERRFLGVVTCLYCFIAVVILIGGFIVIQNLGVIFPKFTGEELQIARMLMTILLGNLTATMLFAPVSSSLVAYERFILIRLLEIGSSILSTVAIVLVLYLGHKVVAVVIVTAVVNLMVLAIKVGYAFLVLKVRLKVEKPELAFLKEIVKFSSAIFIVVVVEQIYWKLDNIFLGAMLGTSAVAVFSIGMSFNKYFMSFGTAISKVMMPKIVRRVEHGADGTELTNLLTSISRIQAVVLLPILTGLIMFGREFIDLWMGPDFQLAYFVMLATMVPFSLELVGNVRNQIMQAKDIYWYRSATVLFMSMIKIALTLVLIPILGMMGAAVSTGLGLLLGYLAVNYILKVKVGIDTWRYSRELAAGLIPAAAASAVVAFLLNLIPGSSWGILSVKIAIYGLAYILAAWYIGMNPYERQLIADLNPRNRKRVAAEGA